MILIASIWVVWCGILIFTRIKIGSLRKRIRAIHLDDVGPIEIMEGTLNPLEPIQWYLRVRKFARQYSSGDSVTSSLCQSISSAMFFLEGVTVLLLVLIVAYGIIGAHIGY